MGGNEFLMKNEKYQCVMCKGYYPLKEYSNIDQRCIYCEGIYYEGSKLNVIKNE